MALINWNNSMSVRVAKIDQQHQKLIAMINDLDDAMKQGKGKEVLGKVLSSLISYTATRRSYLLRRPRGWPKDGRIPDAGMCYRFVLSNPNVHVCMTAPSNAKQLAENLHALRQGPLCQEELEFMRRFGDAVRHTKKWFM